MKPTLTLVIDQNTSKEQMERAVKKLYELKGEFSLIVVMEEDFIKV